MRDESSLTEVERDLITLAAIANPLPLDVIATVLELDDSQASELVDRLVERDSLGVDRRGVSAEPAANRTRTGRARLLLGRWCDPRRH